METKNWPSRVFPAVFLIALSGFLAYSNTFHVPFQFDDDAYIVNNPAIRSFHYAFAPGEVGTLSDQSPTSMPDALRYAFTTRIVGYVTFAANYALHGLDVTGYHAINLLVHILNGILVFLLLGATLKTVRFSAPAGMGRDMLRTMIPPAAALLFVCHPVQTQAVTYVSQRFASLASFFYLLSLLLYVRARISPSGSRRRAMYSGALLSSVAAMLTKEFSFTLPFAIALYDFCFFEGDARERIRRLAPFAVTLAIIPTLVFLKGAGLAALDRSMRTITAADSSGISRAEYLLTQFGVVVLYLRLLFLPIGQNVDHDVPVPRSLFELPVFLSFLLLFAVFSAGVILYFASGRRRKDPELRLASFGILWFFLTLSVESSVIPLGELAAEYRVYLPSVGVIVAVLSLCAFVLHGLVENRARPAAVLYGSLAALVLLLAAATYHRNGVWGSEISLWEDAARKSPRKVRPRQNLGTYYYQQGRLDDARRELEAALALDPGNYEIHNNLGVLYKKMGRHDLALQAFSAVLKINPEDPMVHYNLGNLYLAQGSIPDAIREYRVALERIPAYDEVHNNLGVALVRNGQFPEAIREFEEAIRLNPGNRNARENLLKALGKTGSSRSRE